MQWASKALLYPATENETRTWRIWSWTENKYAKNVPQKGEPEEAWTETHSEL